MNSRLKVRIIAVLRMTVISTVVLGFVACSANNLNHSQNSAIAKTENSYTSWQGTWKLVSVGAKPMQNSGYFIVTGVKIVGHDGCNTFGASFDNPATSSTRMACEGAITFRTEFYYLGTHPQSYTINNDILTVHARDSYPVYVFHRIKK